MLKRAAKPENAQPAAKRKLTRAERKQIEAIIRQAKGDGKPHTVQDSIPFRNLYPDGLCRLDDRLFSKTIAYEDVNYRLGHIIIQCKKTTCTAITFHSFKDRT